MSSSSVDAASSANNPGRNTPAISSSRRMTRTPQPPFDAGNSRPRRVVRPLSSRLAASGEAPERSRPTVPTKCAKRLCCAKSHFSPCQRSVPFGKLKPAGMTPTTRWSVPSSRMNLPMIDRSPLKRLRQSRSLITASRFPLTLSPESPENDGPIRGATPRTRKRFRLVSTDGTRIGSFTPSVRVSCGTHQPATSSNTPVTLR